MIRISEG